MTPFRSTRSNSSVFSSSEEDSSAATAAMNDDDGRVRLFMDNDDDDEQMDTTTTIMPSSPPLYNKTTNHSAAPPTAPQLFVPTTTCNMNRRVKTPDTSDDDDDDDSVLRHMDMNTSPYPLTRRKRPSDGLPAGRAGIMLDGDDDDADAMFLSTPREATPRQESPTTYLTLDGRTVTSKNPFSPYTPTPATDGALDTNGLMMINHSDLQTAPSFPVTLHGTRSFGDDQDDSTKQAHFPMMYNTAIAVRPKLNLQRRDSFIAGTTRPFPHQQQHPAGYPDRRGQYSFTGSPIEEIDFLEAEGDSNHNKIRRLHFSDNASTTAHSLFVDTQLMLPPIKFEDDISPTDVTQFPPSAPRKAPRYTPLRQGAVPQTPMPPRRNVARRPPDDNDGDASMDTTITKSRFYQDFDIIGQLGTGSFGTVYKCLSRLDGCMYAVKAAKRKAKGNADKDRMLKEVYALAALSDQADTAAFHCVRYHQAWMEDNRLYIQTELCSSTLAMEMRLPIERRWKLLREMLLALEFIHRNGMCHLDIKPENIFIKNDQFKLGDFGLVSTIACSNDVEEGDSRYMSRELLSENQDDLTKSDIFSLGATMYEICLGRPLPGNGPEWQAIRSGDLQSLSLNGSTPLEMELVIKEMMHPDPNCRPSASQLLKRKQLLSDEQKQLMEEKSKVREANLALALQIKKLTPPRRGLTRSHTWNGSSPY